eukprot:2929371-Karenia_brevis.AAC.1
MKVISFMDIGHPNQIADDLALPDAICVHIERLFTVTVSECSWYLSVLHSQIDWHQQELTLNRGNHGGITMQQP